MSEIITVTGTVEEIIYSNPDNGYSVVGIDSVEEGQFTATGYMPFITEGESVTLSGNWTTHPDYGEQFKAEYYETVMPSDEESIIKYLSSGIISGIREATAKKLVDHFGLDVLQIMLTQPSRLAEIKGSCIWTETVITNVFLSTEAEIRFCNPCITPSCSLVNRKDVNSPLPESSSSENNPLTQPSNLKGAFIT